MALVNSGRLWGSMYGQHKFHFIAGIENAWPKACYSPHQSILTALIPDYGPDSAFWGHPVASNTCQWVSLEALCLWQTGAPPCTHIQNASVWDAGEHRWFQGKWWDKSWGVVVDHTQLQKELCKAETAWFVLNYMAQNRLVLPSDEVPHFMLTICRCQTALISRHNQRNQNCCPRCAGHFHFLIHLIPPTSCLLKDLWTRRSGDCRESMYPVDLT